VRETALAILELSLIARGVLVADAALKRAVVTLHCSRPVSGGKHLVMLRGGIAEVEESARAGEEVAGAALLDRLFLPHAEPEIWPLLGDTRYTEVWLAAQADDAAAVVETRTVCAGVAAADAALKAARVHVQDMRLAVGISGRAFFTLTGQLDSIEAAVAAARGAAGERLLAIEVIAAPAQELRGRFFR
jgi:microcompartment protein CcmL/EutN